MDTASTHFQNEYHGTTTVHPLALAALLLAALLMLTLPRKWALIPLLVLCCFVPQSQRIVIATIDFTFVRLMVAAGLVRIFIYHEFRGFQLKLFDKLMIAWAAVELVLATLSSGKGIGSAFVYYSGEVGTRIALYFICRALIRGLEDIWRLTAAMAVIAVPVALAFTYEHFTARNIFSIFGGVPAITDLRQGRLRCQGAFAHPILAGCFFASFLPFLAAMWVDRRRRIFSVVGAAAACVIIVMCASSTPVMAALLAGAGMLMIRLRRHMRKLCWATVAMLFVLHMVMNAPVWHLIARVSVVGGSTGWHRYSLIDKFINRWQEWFVRGSSLGTAHWGTGLFDVTNYYIIEGLRGGIVLLVLFIVVLNVGFRGVGRTVRSIEPQRSRLKLLTAWAMGVCLAQHCANFIAVTYFGQINVTWVMQLAMIGSLVPLAESLTRKASSTASAGASAPARGSASPEPGARRPAAPGGRGIPRPAPPGVAHPAHPAQPHPAPAVTASDGPIYSVSPVTTWGDLR